MPDASRALPDRPRRTALRSAAAAVLAVPVIGLVIAESLMRRVGRPVIVVVLLLTGTVGVSAVSTTPIGASSSTTPTPIPANLFRPVLMSDSAVRPVEGSVIAVVPPAATPESTPEATPTPEIPTVVRFRPRGGWTAVSRFAEVSVRFSKPMDHAPTERAFHITVDQEPVAGRVRWAEGDTVLVVDPDRPLPYRSRVTLSVDRGARSADGVNLKAARSVTFTVQSRHAPESTRRPSATTNGWRWPLIGPITQRFGESKTKYGFHQGSTSTARSAIASVRHAADGSCSPGPRTHAVACRSTSTTATGSRAGTAICRASRSSPGPWSLPEPSSVASATPAAVSGRTSISESAEARPSSTRSAICHPAESLVRLAVADVIAIAVRRTRRTASSNRHRPVTGLTLAGHRGGSG